MSQIILNNFIYVYVCVQLIDIGNIVCVLKCLCILKFTQKHYLE